MLVGLGISCIVPTLYSFVGAKSKTPVSIALTILSSISFIGSLIAPLLIGAISQAFDIRIAYMLIGILGGCIVLIVSFSSAFNIQDLAINLNRTNKKRSLSQCLKLNFL